MKIQIDFIFEGIGGAGGVSAAQSTHLIEGLQKDGFDVRVFGFRKEIQSNISKPSIDLSYTFKSTGSSILNFGVLCLRSPFMPVRDDSIIHIFRTVHALPFLYKKNPIICTEGGTTTENMKLNHSRLLLKSYNAIEKTCFKRIEKVVCVDKDTRDFLKQKHGLKEDKLSTIPSSVDLKVFVPDSRESILDSGIDTSKENILYVGRYDKVKNIPMLLEALTEVIRKRGNCHLVMVGGGREEKLFRNLTDQLDISEHVSFLGLIEHDRIPTIMNICDIFVLPSLSEGSPHATKEAIACGLPVVSTNVGDVSTYIKNGLNGYIVEGFQSSDFATSIINALKNKAHLRQGCLNTRETLSVDTMIRKYEEIYYEIAARKVKC